MREGEKERWFREEYVGIDCGYKLGLYHRAARWDYKLRLQSKATRSDSKLGRY